MTEKAAPEPVPCFDLDAQSWQDIKKAASESKWMPPQYFMNDWVHDVCEWLRDGPEAERVAMLESLLRAALPYIKYPRDATDAFVIAHDKMVERIRAALEE